MVRQGNPEDKIEYVQSLYFVNHLMGSDTRVQSFGLSLSLPPSSSLPPSLFPPFSSLSPFPLLPSFPVRFFEKRPKPENFDITHSMTHTAQRDPKLVFKKIRDKKNRPRFPPARTPGPSCKQGSARGGGPGGARDTARARRRRACAGHTTAHGPCCT